MKWLGPSLLAALLLALGVRADAPLVLLGVHRVSDLGLVDFAPLKSGRIVGRYKGDGQCDFKLDDTVIDGVIEGTLFVGMVTVCQSGEGCTKTQRYPFLGVFADDQLVGRIKVAAGCESRGISSGKVEVIHATVQEKEELGGSDGMSAADVANRGGDAKTGEQRLEVELLRNLEDAQRALAARNWNKAKAGFRRVLEASPDSWEAHMGMGIAQVHLKDANNGMASMGKALVYAGRGAGAVEQVAQVQYNRACLLMMQDRKAEALRALRVALTTGPSQLAEDARTDGDLRELSNDKEFKRLLEAARTRKSRNNR